MLKYEFTIFGSIRNKETDRFIDFVEKRYTELTGDDITIDYASQVAQAKLESKKQIPTEKLEKCRFLLENEFKKHFSDVSVEVRRIT